MGTKPRQVITAAGSWAIRAQGAREADKQDIRAARRAGAEAVSSIIGAEQRILKQLGSHVNHATIRNS